MEGDFVVFLIGMRINKWWKVGQWMFSVRAMTRMIKELYANPDLGLKHVESYMGRTSLMVQYWESFEKLEAYARSKDHEHLPAWLEFKKRIGDNGDLGIWHETYRIQKGNYECIYANMPPFGLGKAGEIKAVGKHNENAANRMKGLKKDTTPESEE